MIFNLKNNVSNQPTLEGKSLLSHYFLYFQNEIQINFKFGKSLLFFLSNDFQKSFQKELKLNLAEKDKKKQYK